MSVIRTRIGIPALLAEDLDRDLPRSGAVELREDDGLESAERQLGAVDAERDAAAEQRRAQMRVRVAALAVGVSRVVVTEAAALGNESLTQRHDVVHQRALKLVDEERARGVERVHQGDPRGHRRSMERVPYQLGDIG